MSAQPSLADIRAQLHDSPGHVLCCNLPLYVLLEKRPRPDAPDWVEVGCWKQGDSEGMMVYLSLIDAMIDLYSRNVSVKPAAFFPRAFRSGEFLPSLIEHGRPGDGQGRNGALASA